MASRRNAVAVAVACTAVGVVGGIAGAAAAPSSHKSSSARAPRVERGDFAGPRMGGPGAAVHEDAVVLNKAGTGFITATQDNGTVDSVSGNQLSIKEAVGNVVYKTVTLTIPADATIVRNFKKAALTDLKTGDHVHVSQSSDGTMVFADDGTFRPPMDFGHGPGGFDHQRPVGPPPPGGPGGWSQGEPGTATTTTTSTTS